MRFFSPFSPSAAAASVRFVSNLHSSPPPFPPLNPSAHPFAIYTHTHTHLNSLTHTRHVMYFVVPHSLIALHRTHKTHKPYAGRYDASVVCGRACLHFVREQQKLSTMCTYTQYDNLSLKIVSLKYFTKYTQNTRTTRLHTYALRVIVRTYLCIHSKCVPLYKDAVVFCCVGRSGAWWLAKFSTQHPGP